MSERSGFVARSLDRLFGLRREVDQRVGLATRALDDVRDRSWGKNESDRDRRAFKREEILEQALAARRGRWNWTRRFFQRRRSRRTLTH